MFQCHSYCPNQALSFIFSLFEDRMTTQADFDYLVEKDIKDFPNAFPQAVSEILQGQCTLSSQYPHPVCISTGEKILDGSLVQYFLNQQLSSGFSFVQTKKFLEALRALTGFSSIHYQLICWIEKNVQKPYFNEKKVQYQDTEYTLKSNTPAIPAEILQFLCYVGTCSMKFGSSFSSITTHKFFQLVELTGSDLVEKLRGTGSGDLPEEIVRYSDENVSFFANDAFAKITISMKEVSEDSLGKCLDLINNLLLAEFPKSYYITFETASDLKEVWLPIPGLVHAPVHHFFARCLEFPSLHDRAALYVQRAVKKFEWYCDLEAENCAMPGTFAALGLGLISEKYWPLVKMYLENCDDGHSSIQTLFTPAFVEKFGFTKESLPIFHSCILSYQSH